MGKKFNLRKKQWRCKSNENNGGFTFVETLAVLAVGAVLAAGAGLSGIHIVKQAKKISAKESIGQFKAALQSYYIDCGSFPTSQQGLEALWTKPVLVPVPKNWSGPYLDHELISDPWGSEYFYNEGKSVSLPNEAPQNLPYVIISYGEDKEEGGEGDEEDIVSWK